MTFKPGQPVPPPRRPNSEENTDSWLMSYADMITLLLCFFIIFVSISEPKQDRLAQAAQGLASKFGGAVDLSTPFHGVLRALQGVVEAHQIFQDVAIEKTDRSVEVELAAAAFFQPNSAEFKPGSLEILQELTESLRSADFLDYRVEVEGHTSDIQTEAPHYPSNWEFSAARAARLARFMIEHGINEKRIHISGFAGSQPKVPNTDPNGKAIAQNRERNQRLVVRLARSN